MSASPTKGSATPATSDANTTKPADAITFTDKEEKVLKVAWSCLKSGPPDVDFDKLTELGGFQTRKTAQNTWGVIKKKLMAMAPPAAEGEGDGTPKTPKSKATPKRRVKKEDAGEDGSPTKKAKKTPVKKGKKAAEEDAEVETPVKAEEEAED